MNLDDASNAAIGWIAEHAPAQLQGLLMLLVPVLLRIVFSPQAGNLALDRLAELVGLLAGGDQAVYEFHQRVLPAMNDQERAEYQEKIATAAFQRAVTDRETAQALKRTVASAAVAGLAALL